MKKFLAFTFFLCFPYSTCFGQSWSNLPVDLIVSMNTSTPGTQLTTTIANAGTVSSVCSVGSNCNWTSVNAGFTVGANQNACSNLGPVTINNGGPTYAPQTLNYNSIAHNDADDHTNITMYFSGAPATSQNVSILSCITLGPPAQNNGTDWDMEGIWDTGGHYIVLQFNPSCPTLGQYGVRVESDWTGTGPGTTHSSNPQCISLTPQKTYLFSLNYNMSAGTGFAYVYSTDGTVLGNVNVTTYPGEKLNYITIGNNEAGTNSGTTTYFQNIMMDWTQSNSVTTPLFWTTGNVLPPTNVTATLQ